MKNGLPKHISESQLRSWNEAIDNRRSVRSYQRKPVSDETFASIEKLLDGFSPLCKGARAYLVKRGASRLFTGFLGSFGRISNPPSAAVFAGDVHLPGHMEAIGYLGEAIILEATSLGLGTCWVAGSFSRHRTLNRVRLRPGWKPIAVTPLGYEAKHRTLSEITLEAMTKPDTRKPLDELVSGIPRARWPKGLKDALDAARWAPSARNAQPWRFRVDIEGVTLSVDSGDVNLNSIKRLDCGIAMLHFEVACWASGIRGSWRFPEPGNPIIAKYKFA